MTGAVLLSNPSSRGTLTFDPWVGSSFGKPENLLDGTRLLILGESHHGGPMHPEQVGTCDPGMTMWVVENMALAGSHRFFTNLTQLVDGKPKATMSREEVSHVWESVAFYNYVPVIVAMAARAAPTDQMFERGREPFLRALREHDPEAIIVCGYRLWGAMYNGLPPELQDDAKGQPFRRIGRAIAARMKHPSSGFDALDQHETTLKELFRRVEAERASATL